MNEVTSSGWYTNNWGDPKYSNIVTTYRNTNVVAPKPKTSAEFEALDTENMTPEQVRELLNNALVALEESEEAWKRERESRVSAEETVKSLRKTVEDLREAGFTGVPGPVTALEIEDEPDTFITQINGSGAINEKRFTDLMNRKAVDW